MRAIELNNVSEKYHIKFIKEARVSWEEVWALRDININVEKGEVLGVIGQNGAGKTTLLKLIAGMLVPDKGKIDVKGRVSTLMELGAGFNPEFTGRENIILNARMYGFDEKKLAQQMEKIMEFADLGRFIDAPIKYYSQGMYMRLAFALAIFVEPDILLIDDILAVGDQEAQEKCVKKIFELKEKNKTIVLVSHDINMVDKLCNRVILLENSRIIKEGLPQKVISYYLETVGDKSGIAVLEKEGSRIVFNNGRISISYNGHPLTKGIGGYVTFFVPSINSWISSANLSWEMKDRMPDRIVAEGKSHDEAFSQTWMLRLQDRQLQWQIKIKEETIREPHIDLIIMPQYKRWMALDKDGDFPIFASKSNWQDLGLNDCPDGILGVVPEPDNQDLPRLLVEKKTEDTQTKLFNTGYEQEGRVIQHHLDLSSDNFISIKIFPEIEKFEGYIKEARQRFYLRQQKEQERQRLKLKKEQERIRLRQEREKERLLKRQQKEEEKLRLKKQREEEKIRLKQERERKRQLARCTISRGNLRLFADIDNKTVRLCYKDKEITKGNGFYSSFYVSERWSGLKDAQWRIQKISAEKLKITLDYESLPLSLVWNLNCEEEDVLKVIIKAEVNKPISIINRHVTLELEDTYKKWKSAFEEGGFFVDQYINNIGPIRTKDNKVSKIVLMPESEDKPKLFFDVLSHPTKQALSIYKHKKADEENLCLSSSLIIPKRQKKINPGRYTYFEGRLVLDRDVSLGEKLALANIVKLGKGNLRFVFDKGKGRLFWKEKELTSGLSLYTSVSSSGIWYDSFQAVWQVNEKEDNKIIVTGDWPHIPISQTWQIELIDKNLISWQVDMETYEEVNVEVEQANIMLSPKYRNWAVSGLNRGIFSDEFTEDYNILPYRFWYGKTDHVEAWSKGFPKIIFKNESKNSGLKAIVENTDNFYQSRLLQYQKIDKVKKSPQRYRYFKGVIEIAP